jgi:hypothetical protein
MDNVSDLIAHAYDQKPLEFQTAFNNAIADRLVQAIDNKKIEVAQIMFSQPDSDTELESDTDYQDQEETEDVTTA